MDSEGRSVHSCWYRGDRPRLLARVVALALPIAVTVAGGAVAPAAQAAVVAAAPAKPACPVDRPDEAAALVTARMCGGEVKVAGLTNEYDEGWAQPDGSVRWEHHYRPVRVQRDAAWVPVDTDLIVDADGAVRPKAAAVDLAFSNGGTVPMVTVAEDGAGLRLGSPLGGLPKPVLDGSTATYPDVLPGVDLKLRADVDGYAQVLVLKTRQAAANAKLATLLFPVTATGLTAATDTTGNLSAKAKDGRVRFTGNAPLMWDAPVQETEDGTPRSGGRTTTMKAKLAAGTLSVTPDKAMLEDPATEYPVYLDPGAQAARSAWTMVDSGNPTTSYWNNTGDAKVGTNNGGTNKYRSFYNLNVGATPIAGKYIVSSNLWINETKSASCTARQVDAYATTLPTSSTTWNNQPTFSTLQDSQTVAKGFSSACPAGSVVFSATAITQAAADGGWSNVSLGLRSPNETDNSYYKQFDNNPFLSITYTAYPTITSVGTVPASTCLTGTNRPYINTATPALRVRVTDPEGASVRPEIEWDTLGGTKIGSAQPLPGQASGSLFAATVPAGAFANGSSYSWKARGFDSTTWGPWRAPCEFTVDTTAPSAPPTVTSTAYPSGQWTGSATTAGTFTFGAAGVTDAAAYEYGLDVNPPDKTVAPSAVGGSASVSITPGTDGPHSLYVRTRDRAGNLSTTTRYDFNVGTGAVTSPKPGDVTAADLPLTASAKTTITGVTYQWRRGDADTWTTIPTADVTQAAGGGAVSWPFAGTAGAFAKLNWNTAKTINDAEAGADPLSGPLQVRALFSDASTSSGVTVTFDRNSASAESTDAGPGSVNLLTGNLTLSDTDVSVDSYGSDLTVSRTFNTRRATETDSANMFGPGWVSGVVVDDASSDYTQIDVTGSLVQVGLPDGDSIGFLKRNATTFVPEPGLEDLKLTYTSSPDSYKLADADGNSTTFTKVTGAPASRYFPTAITTPGSNQTSTVSWEKVTVGGADRVRPTRLLAPIPAGVTCTTLAKGCRALTFTYATATTATGTTAATWGDYTGRVKDISFTAWDPDLATPAMRTVVMARYSYDNAGRLRASWDPRLDWTDGTGAHSQQDTYDYNSDGIPTTITPNAQVPWTLTYTTLPGDAGKGRLASVTRSALTAGTATTTVVYNVPVSGSGAPYDLSAGQTSRWGQAEPPVRATAVFPATQIPSGNQAAGTMPSSYERASITYLDANARAVNTAVPGGGLSTTWYDTYGNTVRTLTPGNRQRALDAAPSDTAAVEASIANVFSTTNVYTADGQRLLDTFGPEHTVVLDDYTEVRGRTHTHNIYDENAPATDIPFNLITTATTSVQYVDNGAPVDADMSTTTTGYDWTLRQQTTSTVDPGGLNLITSTAYDASTGLVTSTTAPDGAGTSNTPATRKTTYYRAGTGSGYTECDNSAHWANLVCRIDVGGQPASGNPIPATVTTYDMYNQPRVVTEKTSSTLRTTTTAYDNAGRASTVTVTAAAGLGTAVPVARTVYDQTTGQAVRTQSLVSGTVTAELVRGYDTLGRQTSYTDADNVTSNTTYDLLGRPATTNDGKATRTYTYDGGTERRGLLTSVNDTQAGTFTATYDADGNIITETWPNNLAVTHHQDEAGQDYGIEYTATTGCTTNCTLYAEWTGADEDGSVRWNSNSFSSTGNVYDKAGRLTYAALTVAGQCTMHQYAYDDSTNRTNQLTYGPVPGACTDQNPTSERSSTYDSANRVIDSGYAYDTLGRSSTVPSADTTNAGGILNLAYHSTDFVKSITQNGRTTDYTLDVTGERVRSWTDTSAGAFARLNHYDGDVDSPAWTQETASSYTRPFEAIDGLAAIYNSATGNTNYQIANMHGDVIATLLDGALGLASTAVRDEYGNPVTGSAGTRYGWIGQKQRASDTPSGIVLMGVRLFNSATGRFLQVDPIYGGNANDYEYCSGDPINCFDLDGKLSLGWAKKWGKRALNNSYVRGAAVSFAVGAICVGTAGIGCAVFVGAAAGAALGAANWRVNHRRESWKGHVFRGAASGAFSGATSWGAAKYGARYAYRGRHARWLKGSIKRHRYHGRYARARQKFSASKGWAARQAYRGMRDRYNGWR